MQNQLYLRGVYLLLNANNHFLFIKLYTHNPIIHK